MTEEPIEPLFAYPPMGPQFTIKDLAFALAHSGLAYPTANARVANYAKKRLIHVREKGAGTRPNIFEIHDMGAAVVLSALQDLGIADLDVLQEVSLVLYAWVSASDAPRPVHPITAAVLASSSAEPWKFELTVWRDGQTGERILDPAIFSSERRSRREIPTTARAVATVAVCLNDLLKPVAAKLLSDAG
jgi:hypothetical protein